MKKPELPDLSELKDKLKIDKILNTIAEVVDSNKPFSNADPDDAIGQKIEELDTVVCALIAFHKQNVTDLSTIHSLLSALFDDVNRLRDNQKSQTAAPPEAESSGSTKAEAEESAPEKAEVKEPVAEVSESEQKEEEADVTAAKKED